MGDDLKIQKLSVGEAFSPSISDNPHHDSRPPRILAVFRNGLGYMLDRQGCAVEYEVEMIGEASLLEHIGTPPSDGVWVCNCEMVRGSPSDWMDGSYEWELEGDWRPVDESEWRSFVSGEYVWELPEASDKPYGPNVEKPKGDSP